MDPYHCGIGCILQCSDSPGAWTILEKRRCVREISRWFDGESRYAVMIGIGLHIQSEQWPGANLTLSYDYINGEAASDQFSYDAPPGDIEVRRDNLGRRCALPVLTPPDDVPSTAGAE